MVYVFVDTNIFIHFQHFEQINWPEVLTTDDEITIVLAPVVIEELDKHKFSSNRKISKRAKQVLPRIEMILDDASLFGHKLLYLHQVLDEDFFNKYNLDKAQPDDRLIATIIKFASGITDEKKIALITNDLGVRLKAKAQGVNCIKLSDALLLPNEPDEIEKENLILNKELSSLKNRVPIIQFAYSHRSTILKVIRDEFGLDRNQYVDAKVNEIKAKYPPIPLPGANAASKDNLIANYLNSMNELSNEQINSYNKDLEKFYVEYGTYAGTLYSSMKFVHNTVEIKLMLENKGTSPALDIDIELHFPDGFDVISDEKMPDLPDEPEPPFKPKHRFDFNIYPPMPIINAFRPLTPLPGSISFGNSGPTIKKTNSYNVSFHLKNLKHNQTHDLDILYLKYPDIAKATNFNIEYKLIIANMPNTVSGELHVIFSDKSEQ